MISRRLGSIAIGLALLGGTGANALLAPSAEADATTSRTYESLKNGSFEADAGWSSFAQGAGTEAAVSDLRASHGQRSLRIVDSSSSSAVGWASNAIRVDPGKQYTATALSYVASGHAPLLYLKFYDSAGRELDSTATSASTQRGEWRAFPAVSAWAPDGATHAQVVIYSLSNRTGTFFVDAVDLAPGANASLTANQYFHVQNDGSATPWGWYELDDARQAGSVVPDPTDAANGVLAIRPHVSTGDEWSGAVGTRFSASEAARYSLSMKALRQRGTPVMHAALRYYDRHGEVIGTDRSGIDVVPGRWQESSLTSLAPSGTVEAELIIGCTGTVRCDTLVDDVTVTPHWDTTFYAAPSALGSADGSTPESAADYRDDAFWQEVDAALETGTARVVLTDGQYDVATDDDALHLRGIGSDDHRLLVSGESRFGVVLTQRADLTTYVVQVRDVVNLTVENIHLTADGTYVTPSAFLITEDPTAGERTEGIIVRGISLTDMPGVKYSGVGVAGTVPSGPGVVDVVVDDGLFARGGSGAGYHHVYATRGATTVRVSESVLQDSAGTYVKLRDNVGDWVIEDNIFVSSGTWINNVQFIQWALYNTTEPGNEFFSPGPYRIAGNVFEAQEGWCAPQCRVMTLTARGYNPVDHDGVEWDHLLDPVKREILMDESEGNIETRRAVVRQNFNLALDDAHGISVTDNEYRNIDTLMTLWNTSDYGAPSQGGNGVYDLSNLFATYRDGL
ncbi:hypothetical protein [Georgenia subflava]|uniref:CBM-cenC domain-containing protein n=1 Tax=Georgenia subflava TaxID=1622177 RepID=A0A6N7EMK7_9MICO|nr:hypothetical protein [Georgenia subflava]MPV36474.1 hypothetical protein [Georgenia subflava]